MTFALPRHFLPKAIRKPNWAFAQWRALLRSTWQFGRRHRSALIMGAMAAILVIIIRLAIPFLHVEGMAQKCGFKWDGGESVEFVMAVNEDWLLLRPR